MTTAENLALDEWLLNQCDNDESGDTNKFNETYRVWENTENAIIIGRSSKVAEEVNQDYCNRHNIPFLRRSSGGASVVIGPGCLMYAVVLDYRLRPELRSLDQSHCFVMKKLQQAIKLCGVEVQLQGTCDLTLDGRKFSGNSLRCLRNSFLYHGTLLYDFDRDVVQDCLGTPPRQPDYRQQRSHRDFVTNLPVAKEELVQALQTTWTSEGLVEPTPNIAEVKKLALEKYQSREWTFKR